MPAMDGDGVKITRYIGTPELDILDPFLLLDIFESDQPQDYIGGFPPHPHRGFETVTYLMAGRMRHKDNAGHEGVIEPGGVQWMTAAKGIVHSEMPEQEQGLLQGLQLWVNLPSHKKMSDPAYQEFSADMIALEKQDNGAEIKIIAGITEKQTTGPISNKHVEPTLMDIYLPMGETFTQPIAADDNTFIFILKGTLSIADNNLEARQLGILDTGNSIAVTAKESSRFILVSGKPLHEPVAKGGPFVMNTRAEVLQAFEDYQNNRF